MSADVAQVHGILAGFAQHLRGVHRNRLKGFRGVDQVHGLWQGFHAEYPNTFDDGGFARISFRHNDILDAAFARRQSRGKRATYGAHAAIERKLAEKHVRIQNFAEETSLAAGQTESHRQIERGAFLTDIGGREIDGNCVSRRKIEAAIAQSRANAFAAFLHGNVWQADDREVPFVRGHHVNLGFDQIRVNAEHGCAECLEKHPKMP